MDTIVLVPKACGELYFDLYTFRRSCVLLVMIFHDMLMHQKRSKYQAQNVGLMLKVFFCALKNDETA